MAIPTALRTPAIACFASALSILALGFAMPARADGSRDLFPAGYTGSRANLDLQPGQIYVGVVRRRTFVYVYAQAGEYILLGSSNRIDGNAAGNIRVFDPQSFGTPGDETIPVASNFDCAAGATAVGGNPAAPGPHFFGDPAGAGNITGAIATRNAELAGPRSADDSAGSANTWTPCAYRAPSTGVYGVLFAASDAGGGPNGAIDPPARSSNSVAAWQATVRANATSTTDIVGRAFTYAFAFFTGGNNRPVNADLYYVTSDGFRYQQALRDFDPNGYALYANVSGFLDGGNPLYKNVRGNNAQIDTILPAGTGITAQRAQFPAFFVDVDPAGPNAAAVAQVLGALSIPTTPVVASLDATSFSGALGSGQTVVNLGGTFSLTTTSTITFQIVVSRNGVDFDPATPQNRTLTGFAPGGTISVAWDGNDNAGTPFPPGTFAYRVEGRNGDVHFPIIDAEGNTGGGPTIVRLNGPGTALERRTVYYDDRGYVTRNGTAVGVLNGSLCPPNSGGTPPSTPVSLLGVDSATAYRAWPGNGNDNADCVANTTTQGFGDAKGLDLWTHVSTATINRTFEILGAQADLSVTKTDGLVNVLAGAPISYTIVVSNAGPSPANNAVFSDAAVANLTVSGVTCGSPTGGAACPLATSVTVAALQGSGIILPTFPAGGSLTFTVTGTAGASGSIVNTARIDPPTGTVDPNPTNNNATDVTGIVAPALSLAKTNGVTVLTPGGSTTYTLTVTNSGTAPSSGPIRVVDVLPAGLSIAPGAVPVSGANAASWTCTAAAQVVTCDSSTSIAAPGSSAFAFTASVAANASGSLTNRARVGGGGDPLNPDPPNEGDTTPCTGNGTPRGCAIDTDTVPASAISTLKSVSAGPDGIASPGEVLTYSIQVSNSGGANIVPVVITDPIPANTTYVAGSATGPGASFAPNTVAWTLPPASTFPVTLTFQVTVANPLPAGVASIVNTHTVDGNPGCGTPPCTTTPTPSALAIAKTVADAGGNNQAEPGENLTYTITVSNNGGSPATNVGVTDAFDANTTFVSASNGGSALGNVATWTGLTVPANGSLVLTLTVRVTAPLPVGVTVLRNGVVVTGNPQPDCAQANPPGNCANIPVPRLSLTKTANSASVQAPGPIVYTITVRNIGGVALANVGISDPIPTGISAFAWNCAGTGVACPATAGSGAIAQTVPSLPVGAQLVYTVNATVAPNAPPSIRNTATVTPTTLVNCAPANTPAPCVADVPVATTQGPASIPVDGPLARWGLLLLLGLSGLLALRRRAAHG
jgi:uncharacterized repeat protein (TIGR01451 family)